MIKLTKPYCLAYNAETNEVIVSGNIGNTISTPHTVEQFDSEDELNQFINDNNLILPEE